MEINTGNYGQLTNNRFILNVFRRVAKAVVLCLLYYPIFDLFLFYSYVIRAMSKLGYMPTYNNSDPKTLGFDTHRNLIYSTGEIILVSFGVLVLAVLINTFVKRKILNISKKHYVISSAAFVFFILTALSRTMEWFAD